MSSRDWVWVTAGLTLLLNWGAFCFFLGMLFMTRIPRSEKTSVDQ